jgi:hypothetical protein
VRSDNRISRLDVSRGCKWLILFGARELADSDRDFGAKATAS